MIQVTLISVLHSADAHCYCMKQQATGVPDYLCLSVHEINIAFRIDECPIYAL